MKKTTSFEYQIAADMDALMKSKDFESMFSKTAMLRQAEDANEVDDNDARANPFKKKEKDDNDAKKDKEDKHDAKGFGDPYDVHAAKGCKKKDMEKDHECDDSCKADDQASAEDLIGGFNTAIAVALNSLSKVSEVLDEAGLDKTAALSLTLAHNILVEAKAKKLTKEEAKKLKDKQDAKDQKAKEKAKKLKQEEADKAKADDKARKEKEKAKLEKEKAQKK
jgi:hypothetical protein